MDTYPNGCPIMSESEEALRRLLETYQDPHRLLAVMRREFGPEPRTGPQSDDL